MTWAEFNTSVRELLPVNSSRLGVQTFIDRMIRQAVIELQHYVEFYRKGQTEIYLPGELISVGRAMQGVLPVQCLITDVYRVQTGDNCHRRPVDQWSWDDRYELICGKAPLNGCKSYITLNPHGSEFIAYPALESTEQLELHWDGTKLDFQNTEPTPFDEAMVLCVAEFVKGHLAREVDKDLALHASYFDPVNGSYIQKRRQLYLNSLVRLRAWRPRP